MSFQKPGTVTPSPLDYHSQNSDSKRGSSKGSMPHIGAEYARSAISFPKSVKEEFFKSVKEEFF